MATIFFPMELFFWGEFFLAEIDQVCVDWLLKVMPRMDQTHGKFIAQSKSKTLVYYRL